MPLPGGKSVDEAEYTPRCFGLNTVLLDHWKERRAVYADFFSRIGASGRTPDNYAASQSVGRFVRSVLVADRGICWCPPNLGLFASLFQYFAVQSIVIDYEAAMENNREICNSEASAWIAFRARCYNREAQYREDLRRSQYPRSDSGVQPVIPLPNATQMAYLIAWLIETENSFALTLIASASENDLTFFRTSSRPTEDTLVAMAYVPNRRLIVRTFRTLSPPSTLKTLDAFILV